MDNLVRKAYLRLIVLLALLIWATACGNGRDGLTGPTGASCSIKAVANGAIITCEDGTSSVIFNGVDGKPSAYDVMGITDPCGKQAAFDEVLLILANGTILAHYASGVNQYLTKVTPGNFVTTDGTSCHFTVHTDMSVTW